MELRHVVEPRIVFKYDQALEDPRDGLTLFGPLDQGSPYGIRAGVIGTEAGIQRFKRFVTKLQGPIVDQHPARLPFPGFDAAFRIPWRPQPYSELAIDEASLTKALRLDDAHQRVYAVVDLFARPLVDSIRNEEGRPDLWFVVIPDDVHRFCRPKSRVDPSFAIRPEVSMNRRRAELLQTQASIFPEDHDAANTYLYEVDFHNQLKARLLAHDCPTQIVRESTLAHADFLDALGRPTRNLDDLQSAIAWGISTATFYKAGGRPWKSDEIRPGVCYVGLVFKRDHTSSSPNMACCAAQMFLDSGDGVVFRGAVGPWYVPETKDFHLSTPAARALVRVAIETYQAKTGKAPSELFLHGRVRFDNDEWTGFQQAAGNLTKVVGVRIRETRDLKLFTPGSHPVLRGLAYVRDNQTAYIWTKGFIPRLQTYIGREVPNPLLVDICRGHANMDTVLADIMALTKLNYNSCIFGDGVPVTLKFAEAVGEVLTAAPTQPPAPLPFKLYI